MTKQQVEAAAKAVYSLDPFRYEQEYMGTSRTDLITLSWEQAKAADAEFESHRLRVPITKFAYDAARAAFDAIAGHGT